ncbi:hypothetical protein GUITHDRAFT_39604, partial [Guillardia theta CCMP2712]
AGRAEDPLVQHVILRKDLTKKPLSWPAGSMIAQACHVVSKTLWEMKDHANVQHHTESYMCSRGAKVTLSVESEEELLGVSKTLQDNGIEHRVWKEQPEGILTAIATIPYPKSVTVNF